MKQLVMYGIKNCDTMKKAFQWLENNGIAYTFHDYKKEGISAEKLFQWLEIYPTTVLANTKGPTWRQLSDEEKSTLQHPDQLVSLLQVKTSAIKRPLVELNGKAFLLGFNETEWVEKFKRKDF